MADAPDPFASLYNTAPAQPQPVATRDAGDPFGSLYNTANAARASSPAPTTTFVPFTAQPSVLSRVGDFLTSTHEVPAVAGTERAIANIPSHIADSFLPQVNLNTSAQDVASGLARKNVAMLGGNASTTEIMLAIENAVQNVNRPGSAGTFAPFAAANAARQIDAAKQNPLTRLGDLIAQAQAHAGEAGQPSLAQPAQNTSVGDVLGALQMPSHDLDWMTDPRYSGLRAGEAALGSLSHLAGLIPYGSDHSLGSDAWMRAEDPEVASLTDLAGQIALTSAVPSIGLGDRFAGIGKAINAVGIKGAVSKGLVNTVDRLPGGAVGFGAPAAVQTYEAVKNAGGSQKEAIEDASAQLGLRTLMGSAPLSSELGATNKFVRAAARGTTAGAGALGLTEAGQALNHALAPDVMPSLDQSGGTSPYMPGAIALMAALLGHRAHPEGVTAKAPENAKGASAATDPIEAALRAANFSDADIAALKASGSNIFDQPAAPALQGPPPDAPLPVDATRALPAPEPQEPAALALPPPARQLPPPTIAVDSAGNAATNAQALDAARAADAAAQDRQNLGLTPDVERAQQARQAGVQAAEAEALQRGEPGEVRAPEPQPARAPVDPALEQRYFDDLDKEIGWDQVGGSIVRRMNSDTTGGEAVAGGDVVGRTSWIGKPRVDSQDKSDFWRARPANARLTPDKASAALAKARAGEPLKPIEQRFVDYAHQQAHDYAQEHADETAHHEQALQEQNDIERQQDIEGLRNEAAQFHSADANDALAYHQWVARALDAGVPVDDIPSVMGSGTLGERVQRLAQAIRERGGEHGTDTGADGFDHASDHSHAREGQDDELPPARDGAAEPSQQPRGDLFAAATGADQLRAARESKDAERNGLNRPQQPFTNTDLGATPHGEAPEQAGFGTTQVPAKLAREGDMRASRPTGGSVPETPPPVDEISEHHLSPEDQELVRSTRARAAESRDNRAAESTLEQDSRERGEREAGELGLRGAVVEALGPERVAKLHFVHDADGLPEDVRRRGTPIKRGNVRYGMHTPEGDSYIFTKHANTPERAAWTAIHEVGGHGGVQELVNAHPDVKVGARSVKEAYESARKLFLQNPTVAKLADVISKQRGSADRPRMAEEAMAELQAAARTGNWDEIGRKYGVDVPKGVRQGVQGAIANFVRRLKAILNAIHAKITGKSGQAFTDADVHDMLSSMWEASQGERGSGEHLASEEPRERGSIDRMHENDYRGQHRPPDPTNGVPIHDLTQGMPEDVYGPDAAHIYGHGGPSVAIDRQTFAILKRLRGKPDADVTIYRAVPSGEERGVNAGDWVTVNRKYAVEHGEGALEGKYAIASKVVKARDLYTNGDSLLEAGYWPDESGPSFSEEPQDRADTMGRGASGPAPEEVTGIKNAQTAKERAARGLDELDAEGRRSFGTVWDSAARKLADDPHAGQALAEHVANSPRALTAEETALLAQDRARISVQRRTAAEDVNKAVASGDETGEAIARAKMKLASDQMDVNDKAARQSGYEQGLGLAIRKAMAKLDYSLDAMEQRLQAAKGDALNPADLKRLKDLHEQMQGVDAEIAGRTEAARGRQQETKAQLQEQLRLFKDQWQEAESRRDVARQKQLRKQIMDLAQRIAKGDYSKTPRTPIQYNEETNRLLAQRNFLRRKFDRMAAEAEHKNRSKAFRAWNTFLALRRAVILSGLHTVGKLTSAALLRIGVSPVEHAVQHGLGMIPGLRGIAARAPVEGRFSPRAEGGALKDTFSKDTLKEMALKFGNRGTNDLLYGHDRISLHPWLEMVAQLHAALKTPAERNFFARASRMLSEWEAKQAKARGLSDSEVADYLARPDVQALINARAYNESMRAVFKHDNVFVKSVRALQNVLRNVGKNDEGGNVIGKASAEFIDYMFPIVKIPSNYIGEAFSYLGGAGKAAGQLYAAKVFTKGVEALTPEQADYIMRNLGKQTIGLALAAIGYAAYGSDPKVLGTFYQQGDNKRKNVPHEGSIGGIPDWLVEHPGALMLTFGANYHRIQDGIKTKTGKTMVGTGDDTNAAMNSIMGLLRKTPYIDTIENVQDKFRNKESVARWAGNEAASAVIQPDIKRYAKSSDKAPRRYPQGFLDALKMNVPGLREQVPTKPAPRH